MTVEERIRKIVQQLGPPPFQPNREYAGFWSRETKRSKHNRAFWEGQTAMWRHAVEAIGAVAKAAAMEQVYPEGPAGADGRPTIVCLCGSTRFKPEFGQANLRETMAGKIVLSIGCDTRSDTELFGSMSAEQLMEVKAALDELHFRKIELADEVLILNVDGYIGDSTRRELGHARKLGKRVRFLEPEVNVDGVRVQVGDDGKGGS